MKTQRFLVCLGAVVILASPSAFAQQTGADYYNLAGAAMKTGDFDVAIANFTKAMALEPALVQGPALSSRGFAKMHQGDLSGALADFNHALALNPKANGAYYGRAVTEQIKDDLDDAIKDYEQVIALAPPNTGGGDNPHFFVWLARVQLNQKTDADKELSDYLAKRPSNHQHDMHAKIGAFLLGQVSEVDLATDALSFSDPLVQNRAQCESFYFMGMKRLIAGNKSVAADDFRKCLATDQTVLLQYPLAKAAAEAIELNPPQ